MINLTLLKNGLHLQKSSSIPTHYTPPPQQIAQLRSPEALVSMICGATIGLGGTGLGGKGECSKGLAFQINSHREDYGRKFCKRCDMH